MPFGANAFGAIEYAGDLDHYQSTPPAAGATDDAAGFWWFGPGAAASNPLALEIVLPALMGE